MQSHELYLAPLIIWGKWYKSGYIYLWNVLKFPYSAVKKCAQFIKCSNPRKGHQVLVGWNYPLSPNAYILRPAQSPI